MSELKEYLIGAEKIIDGGGHVQIHAQAIAEMLELIDKSESDANNEINLPLGSMQVKKLRYLQEKGGVINSSEINIKISMPDGELANIDTWGRVTWIKPSTPSDK